MKLNHTQAAKHAGISRQTLYAHVKKGKVTQHKDEDSNPFYDLSELIRVYGEPVKDVSEATPSRDGRTGQSGTPPFNSQLDLELEVLRVKLQAAERRAESAEEEKDRLLGIIETQTKQLAAPQENHHNDSERRKGFWGRLFG